MEKEGLRPFLDAGITKSKAMLVKRFRYREPTLTAVYVAWGDERFDT
jgi:hypothetical protein